MSNLVALSVVCRYVLYSLVYEQEGGATKPVGRFRARGVDCTPVTWLNSKRFRCVVTQLLLQYSIFLNLYLSACSSPTTAVTTVVSTRQYSKVPFGGNTRCFVNNVFNSCPRLILGTHQKSKLIRSMVTNRIYLSS